MAADGVRVDLPRGPVQGVVDRPGVRYRCLSALLFLMGAGLLVAGAVALKSQASWVEASPWAPKLMLGIGAGLIVVSLCCCRAAQPTGAAADAERARRMHDLRNQPGRAAFEEYNDLARLRWPVISPDTCRLELAAERASGGRDAGVDAERAYGTRLREMYKTAYRRDVEACAGFLQDLSLDLDLWRRLGQPQSAIGFAWSALVDGSAAVQPDGRPADHFAHGVELRRCLELFQGIEAQPHRPATLTPIIRALVRASGVERVARLIVIIHDDALFQAAMRQLITWAPFLIDSASILRAAIPQNLEAPDGMVTMHLAHMMANLVTGTTGAVQTRLRQVVLAELESWARLPLDRPDLIGPYQDAVTAYDLLEVLRRAGVPEASLTPVRVLQSNESSVFRTLRAAGIPEEAFASLRPPA